VSPGRCPLSLGRIAVHWRVWGGSSGVSSAAARRVHDGTCSDCSPTRRTVACACVCACAHVPRPPCLTCASGRGPRYGYLSTLLTVCRYGGGRPRRRGNAFALRPKSTPDTPDRFRRPPRPSRSHPASTHTECAREHAQDVLARVPAQPLAASPDARLRAIVDVRHALQLLAAGGGGADADAGPGLLHPTHASPSPVLSGAPAAAAVGAGAGAGPSPKGAWCGAPAHATGVAATSLGRAVTCDDCSLRPRGACACVCGGGVRRRPRVVLHGDSRGGRVSAGAGGVGAKAGRGAAPLPSPPPPPPSSSGACPFTRAFAAVRTRRGCVVCPSRLCLSAWPHAFGASAGRPVGLPLARA
jgi:hypothetical protein